MRAPILLSALDHNIIPDPIGANKEQCKWCPYKDFCKNDGFDKIAQPFMKKDKIKKKVKKEKPKVTEAKFLL